MGNSHCLRFLRTEKSSSAGKGSCSCSRARSLTCVLLHKPEKQVPETKLSCISKDWASALAMDRRRDEGRSYVSTFKSRPALLFAANICLLTNFWGPLWLIAEDSTSEKWAHPSESSTAFFSFLIFLVCAVNTQQKVRTLCCLCVYSVHYYTKVKQFFLFYLFIYLLLFFFQRKMCLGDPTSEK